MNNDHFPARTLPTVHWLLRSIRANGGKGSSACYHLWKGWGPPYPETTGYLLDTLFDYAGVFGEPSWREAAFTCAGWLCEIQRPDGAFTDMAGRPIVFDTAMILFGLKRAFRESGEERYRQALQKTVTWLLDRQSPEGGWPDAAYSPGFQPTYYTQVIWAVLAANEVLDQPGLEEKMQQALTFFRPRIIDGARLRDAGFHPGQPAFTHTLAYAWQGFLESGLLLEDVTLTQAAAAAADHLISFHQSHGRLAGSYDENGKGDDTFRCLTGNAQLSFFLSTLYRQTREEKYRDYAQRFLDPVRPVTSPIAPSGWRGGIAGSRPFWGPYQRWRFPNWAAKFYLDACLMLR